MYFNYSPHGYCVEETFRSFVPEYLENAALITDNKERWNYLQENLLKQFEDFEHFVRNDICRLVSSLEGFHRDNAVFLKWVQVVAKKHEHTLLKEYMMAVNSALDRKVILEEFYRSFNYLNQ